MKTSDDNNPYGPWKFDPINLTLTHRRGYEIDVEDWTTSAKVLDWVFQIYDKNWCDEATIMGLLEAMRNIVHPQKNLCSCGKERGPINVEKAFIKEQNESRIATRMY